MTPDEQKIHTDLMHNSFVFFKDFIDRLTNNDNPDDDRISKELVILSVSSLQISLELALKAVVIKKLGLINLLNSNYITKTNEDLFLAFQNNSLKTKQFEQIKIFAKNNDLICTLSEDDYETITEFQRYRKGIVHFSFIFQEGDYFDLKYDITYFVVNILIKVLCAGDDEIKPSEFLEYQLGTSYHKKLINYRPYIEAMERIAKERSEKIFSCISCNNRTYSKEEEYCYCCNFYGEYHSFRNCEFCNEKASMIYDGLNLESNNFTARAQCLNCHQDTIVFVCPDCEISYNLETTENYGKICSLGTCKMK